MAHRKPVRLREVKRADMKQMKATDHRTLSISSARIAAQNMTWTELSIRRLAARRGFVCEFCDERINDSGHASRPAAYERHLDRHHGLELYLRNDYVCYSCRDMTRYRSEPALMLHFVQSHRTGWFYGTPKRCRSACYAYRRRPQASQRKLNLQKTSDKTYHENVIWDHALLGNLSKLRYYCSDEERLLRALEIGTGYTRSVGQVSRIREKLMPARFGYVLPQAPRRYGSSRSLSRSNSNSSAPSRLTAAAMSEDGVSEVARPFKALITVLIDLQRQLKSQHRIRRFFFPAIRQERRKLLNFTASVIERAEKIFGVAIFVENGDMAHELNSLVHHCLGLHRQTAFPSTRRAYVKFHNLLKSHVDPIIQLWETGVETREAFLNAGQDLIDSIFLPRGGFSQRSKMRRSRHMRTPGT